MTTYEHHVEGAAGYGTDCERLPGADGGLTRRRLLGLAAATAATAALWPGALTPASAASTPARAAGVWRRSRYLPHVGDRFELTAPGGPTVLVRLAEIKDLSWARRSASARSEDGFVLLFRGPASPRLHQDVMSVRHPVLGRLELLVSPAGTGVRSGQDYAAVINRLTPPT